MSTDELNVAGLPRPVIVEIVDVPIVVDVIFTFPLSSTFNTSPASAIPEAETFTAVSKILD